MAAGPSYVYYYQSLIPNSVPAWPVLPTAPVKPGDQVRPEKLTGYYSRFNGRRMIVNDWIPLMSRWRCMDLENGEIILVRPENISGRVLLGKVLGLPVLDDSAVVDRLRSVGCMLAECLEDSVNFGSELYGSITQGYAWCVSGDLKHNSPWGVHVFVVPVALAPVPTSPPSPEDILEILKKMSSMEQNPMTPNAKATLEETRAGSITRMSKIIDTLQPALTLTFVESKIVEVMAEESNRMAATPDFKGYGKQGGKMAAAAMSPQQLSARAAAGAAGRAKKRALSSPSRLATSPVALADAGDH